jgi:tRNA G18 (ribose-2'-O)-methylase SpoU
MPRVPIDDLDDPRVAVYRDLKATRQNRHRHLFVVGGEKLFQRLVESRFPLASVLVTDHYDYESKVTGRVAPEIPVYLVPHALVRALLGIRFHRGILACAHREPLAAWEDVLPHGNGRSTVLVCPKLDDPDNLGTLLRTAEAFGVDLVVLGPQCPDPLSRRVLRVSMGSSLRLPWMASDHLEADLDRLERQFGHELVATVVDPAAEPLDSFQRPARVALLFGSESHGLSPEWRDRCTRKLTIPIVAPTDSLNVAIAAGLILYHLARQP